MKTSPCINAEVRFDIENAGSSGACLIHEVEAHTGGSKPNKSRTPARRPRGAFPQRGKGTPLVPQHDVAVTEVAEQHRIEEGIQPHRSLQNRQTVEWTPGNRQDMTIEILRGIRIEFQRSLVSFYGLICFAASMEDISKRRVRRRQQWIPLHRCLGEPPCRIQHSRVLVAVVLRFNPCAHVAVRQQRIGRREARVEGDGLFEPAFACREGLSVPLARSVGCAEIQVVGPPAFRRFTQGPVPLRLGELGDQNPNDTTGDFILHCEYIAGRALVAISPAVGSGGRFDQLDGDADAISAVPDAALDHVLHAKLLSDRPDVDLVAPVAERRVRSDNEQPRKPRQSNDDVRANAVADIALLGVTSGILKR
jgi:hypothetical protein